MKCLFNPLEFVYNLTAYSYELITTARSERQKGCGTGQHAAIWVLLWGRLKIRALIGQYDYFSSGVIENITNYTLFEI